MTPPRQTRHGPRPPGPTPPTGACERPAATDALHPTDRPYFAGSARPVAVAARPPPPPTAPRPATAARRSVGEEACYKPELDKDLSRDSACIVAQPEREFFSSFPGAWPSWPCRSLCEAA